jgi:hypothetical protein
MAGGGLLRNKVGVVLLLIAVVNAVPPLWPLLL